MGYLNGAEKNSAAFDEDGYLRSGDVGAADPAGVVSVVARIKELLVTAGGENVAPAPVEDAIKAELPCVAHAVAVGDRRKFVSALLTLKTDAEPETGAPTPFLTKAALEWCTAALVAAGNNGEPPRTAAEAAANPSVAAALQAGVDRANDAAVSNAAKVKKWILLPSELSLQGGELGPTMKVKRHVVLAKYAELVDKMYA